MRKIYDIVGDYSQYEAHSGIPENLPGRIDGDFLVWIESYIQSITKLGEINIPEIIRMNNGFSPSINGFLKGISHEERIRKYTYAVQRLCEIQQISNLNLGVLVDKSGSIALIQGLTKTFFNEDFLESTSTKNIIELTKIAREVLTIDSSLDHIIKPIIAELLFGQFYHKMISFDVLFTHIYNNQNAIDITYLIKRIQSDSTVEPDDVIGLLEKQKENPSFLEFLQKFHFIFDKNQLKPNHEKKIFPGITKNHLRIGGKSIHIQHNPVVESNRKLKKIGVLGVFNFEESNPIYGLQYENGKYSLLEYQGDRNDPIRQYSKKEILPLIKGMNPDLIKTQLKNITGKVSKETEDQFKGFMKAIPMVDATEREELEKRTSSPSPIPISDISLLNKTTSLTYSPFDQLTNIIQQVESGAIKNEEIITKEIYSGVKIILEAMCNRKNGRLILSGELDSSFKIKHENIPEHTVNVCIRIASKGKYRSRSEVLSILKNGIPVIETFSGIEVTRENIDTIVQRFGYEYIQTPYTIIAGRDYQSDSEGDITEREKQSYEYANKLEAIFQMMSTSKNPPKGKIKIYGSEDQSYAFFYYVEKNVTIFVSNLYGKATYIFRGEIAPNEIAKSSLLELAKHRNLLERLYYNPASKEAWLKRIMDALDPQKDAANILVKLYKEGILKEEHIGTSHKFNTFVTNWNAFISSNGLTGDFPITDPWTDFVTNELVETGDYNHLRLTSNRVEDSSISIAGIINALGGDKAFTHYKGMTYFLGDYLTLLLQNQLYPDAGNMEMAKYLAEEVFQGSGASRNVKDWVSKLLQGDLSINTTDLESWTSPEIRSKHNIPVGIQTIPTLGIKLKLPVEKRTPNGISDYITTVRQQVETTMI